MIRKPNLVELARRQPFLYAAARRIKRVVDVMPFYLFEEGSATGLDFPSPIPGGEVRFLSRAEVQVLSRCAEVPDKEHDLLSRLDAGCGCLALMHQGAVAAFVWYQPRKAREFGLRLPARDDLAFLFDARTMMACRGRNAAPFLRTELYRRLRERGWNVLLSSSHALNTAALRFKEKLRARRLGLYLGVRVWRSGYVCVCLRRYSPQTQR
jgi:hypothetical protein